MPEEPLHNPHDRFFKETLGRKETAAAFFREYLPPELVRAFDWEKLEKIDGSFVDETLRERHSDLLFTVPWKSGKVSLYCLFEHQSEPDRWMAFRILRYMVRIWEAQLHAEPHRRTLSPILPIVLHQSKRRWKVSVSFSSLLEVPKEIATELADSIPEFSYRVVDLADWPMEELRGDVTVRAILATMKLAASGELVERLPEISRFLSRLLYEGDAGFVRVCLEYLMRGSGNIDLQRFRASLQQITNPEIKEDVMTLADQLIQEGRQEGRQEGEAALLQRQLARRFGPLPEWARERLNQASGSDLERWSVQILEAAQLEDVFK